MKICGISKDFNEFLRFFRTDNDLFFRIIKNHIEDNKKQIIKESQEYLNSYESGLRVPFCTDIEKIYDILTQ